jgi:hypothetical protein
VRVLTVLIIVSLATSARAADEGMYLCRSPVVANDLWTGLLTTQQTGVRVDQAILQQFAAKNECPFVPSGGLKPKDYVAGELLMTDGKIKGWAAPQYYILYVNKRTT